MSASRESIPLAHSARAVDAESDPYPRHIEAVRRGTRQRAAAMLQFARNPPEMLLETLDAAATYHDLGKLDEEIQTALRRGRGGKPAWDHIDAGVAQLQKLGCPMAAWLVRAHHPPGLPQKSEHFDRDNLGRRLRGRRHDDAAVVSFDQHVEQIARTDAQLSYYTSVHDSVVSGSHGPIRSVTHGLAMRLALSCLVDADHADTAWFDTGVASATSPEPRWDERLIALQNYIDQLSDGDTQAERERNDRRKRFFEACLNSPVDAPIVTCEGPVGIGKTTAVAAYLLRRARDEGLRRLIVVAPYTNILKQTAEQLREAIGLPGEELDQVVVEHHHRADFDCREECDLAVLWQAPVVLTTAVSFFETLAACRPGTLRKLHAVPGSAIFIDEAHAAIPVRLWPQNFRWLRDLADNWGCRLVLASGSLTRFWDHSIGIIDDPSDLPELLPPELAAFVFAAERRRIRYDRLADGEVVDVATLVDHVQSEPGPRLVILNTVQNAAVVAEAMLIRGADVLHLSTALTPNDRETILNWVKSRLSTQGHEDWTLVATSCVEAGVDLSFRTAFRERFAVASILQVGGRVNRHGEYDEVLGGTVYDVALHDLLTTAHPEAKASASVLKELLEENTLNTSNPSDVVTEALCQQISEAGGPERNQLGEAESQRDYPQVAELGRVIAADTRLVVVEGSLRARLADREKITFQELLGGSVQLWMTRINRLGLEPLWPGGDVYAWNSEYDPEFLGYMAGILKTKQFIREGGVI